MKVQAEEVWQYVDVDSETALKLVKFLLTGNSQWAKDVAGAHLNRERRVVTLADQTKLWLCHDGTIGISKPGLPTAEDYFGEAKCVVAPHPTGDYFALRTSANSRSWLLVSGGRQIGLFDNDLSLLFRLSREIPPYRLRVLPKRRAYKGEEFPLADLTKVFKKVGVRGIDAEQVFQHLCGRNVVCAPIGRELVVLKPTMAEVRRGEFFVQAFVCGDEEFYILTNADIPEWDDPEDLSIFKSSLIWVETPCTARFFYYNGEVWLEMGDNCQKYSSDAQLLHKCVEQGILPYALQGWGR